MKKTKLKGKDLAYYVFQILRYPVKWFMHSQLNLNLVKNEAKDDEGPFIIIGNHLTAYDPIIALVYLKPLVKWVASDSNYYNKIKTFFMKWARVIPITKKYGDIRTIKRMIKEVKAGNSVGIYPEGGRTWHGETDELISSTAKLIKLLGVKVYNLNLAGAFMSSPRWGRTIRKGRVDVTIYQMLSGEEVKKMTDEEILVAMKEHLHHNDYDYQRKEMVKLAGKDHAEYIERIIYVCPNCHHIHTFASLGDEFKCKECQAKGTVNEYGFIEGDFPYDNLVDWYHFQEEYLYKYLEDNTIKPIELYDVKHRKISEDGEREKYLVDLFIYPNQMIIAYEDGQKKIDYKKITPATITFKNTIIFYDNKIRYEFVIEPFLHHNASVVYIKKIINFLRGQ